MAAMLHGRNNRIFFLLEKLFILIQNIFVVSAMQHGQHAKPLYGHDHVLSVNRQGNLFQIHGFSLLRGGLADDEKKGKALETRL